MEIRFCSGWRRRISGDSPASERRFSGRSLGSRRRFYSLRGGDVVETRPAAVAGKKRNCRIEDRAGSRSQLGKFSSSSPVASANPEINRVASVFIRSVPSVFSVLKDFRVCESRKNSKAFNTEDTEGTEKTKREADWSRWSPVTSHQSPHYRSCTSDSGEDGGAATGLSVCGPRQLSTTAICCTQETVQSGAQCFFVKYSRRKSSAVYFSSGMPG